MATVTTFAEFMTALNNSEVIDLANDIDGADYGTITHIYAKANINGNGHTISNVLIYGGDAGFRTNNGAIVKDVYFKNVSCESTASMFILIAQMSGTTGGFSNCRFSISIDANNGTLLFIGSPSTAERINLTNCAFDITLSDDVTFNNTVSIGIFSRCNVVFRNSKIRPSYTLYPIGSNSSNKHVAVVFDGCTLATTTSSFSAYLQCVEGYIAFRNCTTSLSNISVSGSSNTSLFCNDSSISASAGTLTTVTPAQLKSESYLRSIGFLP